MTRYVRHVDARALAAPTLLPRFPANPGGGGGAPGEALLLERV